MAKAGSGKRSEVTGWLKTGLEIGKWALVLWLLLPLRQASAGPILFGRVALGILLFIIFTGKMFYDTIIEGYFRQRRMSARQDLLSLVGIVLVVGLVVGLVIFLVGFMMLEFFEMMRQRES